MYQFVQQEKYALTNVKSMKETDKDYIHKICYAAERY